MAGKLVIAWSCSMYSESTISSRSLHSYLFGAYTNGSFYGDCFPLELEVVV